MNRSLRLAHLPALLAGLLLATAAAADEGMWTYDHFPSAKVKEAYGFAPTQPWLDHVRLSSVRLARGCSGSFVSGQGLVLTNHHCAQQCIDQLSTGGKNLMRDGFVAKALADEPRCPDVEVNQLVKIEDVTEQVRAATKGLEGEAFNRAQRAEKARLEKACATSDAVRCDVVTLYQGGAYALYTYKRFQDVRLVFAPEFAIAFFGGDPDNFMFPRWDLDLSFLRVYEGGKPAVTKDYFPWSPKGVAAGELTFVSGHPGGTDRTLTVAELAYQRDRALPDRLAQLSELRGLLTGFQLLGPEQKRISESRLFYIENSLKVLRGRVDALQDKAFFGAKAKAEEALRSRMAADPAQREAVASYAAIDGALDRLVELRKPYNALERGFDGKLFSLARLLVRGAAERAKPDGERLEEWHDSNLPALTQELFSPAPIYPELERLLLGHALTKIRERLGPDHPAVKKLLGSSSPDEIAKKIADESRLRDVAARKALWEGGAAAVEASTDPAVVLARLVDPDARAARKVFEDDVESVVKKAHERIASARFAVEGRDTYPDATFTLRLSYGQVKGWKEGATEVAPFTNLGGAFERATGRPPFDLPPSWIAARGKLDLSTPFDFCSTNDIIGGNSGSPVVNKDAQLVGLVFDGNIHSLGGDYGFDPVLNRTVAVDSRAILHTMDAVYGATRVADELRAASKAAGKKK